MNELIRELVRESNLDVYGLGKERYRWEYTVEKFAELIIRECITVINQPNGVGDDDVIRITKDVEKHFGVEE